VDSWQGVFLQLGGWARGCWVVTSCNVVAGYQRFGGPCCFHLQGDNQEEHKIETITNCFLAKGNKKGEGVATKRNLIFKSWY
jgi:hypothetical protein